mgnify:CR=1 FL=1
MKISRASKTIALSTSSSNIRVISQSSVKLSKLHLYNVICLFKLSKRTLFASVSNKLSTALSLALVISIDPASEQETLLCYHFCLDKTPKK